MRSFPEALTFLIAVSLIASRQELSLEADRTPPKADGIPNQAVSPPLLAADFRPKGFDAKKHRALDRQAEQALASRAPQRALTLPLGNQGPAEYWLSPARAETSPPGVFHHGASIS